MRIIALYLLKHNGDDPFMVHHVEDISFMAFYKRPFFRQHMNFGARTAVRYHPSNIHVYVFRKIKIGERNKIDLKEIPYFAYVQCLSTKLVGMLHLSDIKIKKRLFCVTVSTRSKQPGVY